MRKISGILAALGLLVALAPAGPAAADRATHRDPKDTPGKLDIKSVTHAHEKGRLVTIIRTYGKWKVRDLAGANRFLLFSKAKGKVTKGTMWWKNGEWFCTLPGNRRPCSQMPGLTVKHPNPRTLVLKNIPPKGQKSYKYRVGTRYKGHTDWAPSRRGWYLHKVR